MTNSNKPGKDCVVFDVAASYKASLLNDQLVTGLNLSLIGTNPYHCFFIFRNTRLATFKNLTIPRLELQAAVMAVRMSPTIQRKLDVMLSLSCIKSQGTIFHVCHQLSF